jgi:hypothetical protein
MWASSRVARHVADRRQLTWHILASLGDDNPIGIGVDD